MFSGYRLAVLIALVGIGACEAPPVESHTFTVFLEDDGDFTTRAGTLADATVTVDADGELFTAVTDDDGQVRFDWLQTPFYVTAQYDLDFGDGIARIASTRWIEGTDAREFGILMMGGGDSYEPDGEPDPDTRITGTIRNVPEIPAGYSLDVVTKIEGWELGWTTVLNGPTTGVTASVDFALADLPPGPHVVYAAIRQPASAVAHWGWKHLEVAVSEQRTLARHQESVLAVVDFDASSVRFAERQVEVDGWAPGAFGPVFDVIVRGAFGGEIPIGVHGATGESTWTAPTSLWLAESASDDLLVSNAFGTWTLDDEEEEWSQALALPLDTEGTLVFDLVPALEITAPRSGARVSASGGLDISWVGGDASTAITDVWIEGEPTGLDVDFVSWLILLSGDASDVRLPGVALDMLAPGEFGVGVYTSRAPGHDGALGVDAYSGPDAPDQIRALFPQDYWDDAGASLGFLVE